MSAPQPARDLIANSSSSGLSRGIMPALIATQEPATMSRSRSSSFPVVMLAACVAACGSETRVPETASTPPLPQREEYFGPIGDQLARARASCVFGAGASPGETLDDDMLETLQRARTHISHVIVMM